MENRKDIGRAFKEKLDGLHREPADSLWDAIGKDLDKKRKKTLLEKLGPYSLNILVVALLVLLCIAGYLIIGFKNTGSNDTQGMDLKLNSGRESNTVVTDADTKEKPLNTQANNGNKTGRMDKSTDSYTTGSGGSSNNTVHGNSSVSNTPGTGTAAAKNTTAYGAKKGTGANNVARNTNGILSKTGQGNVNALGAKRATIGNSPANIGNNINGDSYSGKNKAGFTIGNKGKTPVAGTATVAYKNSRDTTTVPIAANSTGTSGKGISGTLKTKATMIGKQAGGNESIAKEPVSDEINNKALTAKENNKEVSNKRLTAKENNKEPTSAQPTNTQLITGDAGNKEATDKDEAAAIINSKETTSKQINNGPASTTLKVTDADKTNPTSNISHEEVTHEKLSGPLSKQNSLTEEEITDVLDCSADSLCIRPDKKDYAKELAEERRQKKVKDTTDYKWFVGLNLASAKFHGMEEALAGDALLKNRYWKSLSNNYVNAYIGHKLGRHMSIQAGLAVFAINYYTNVRISNTYVTNPNNPDSPDIVPADNYSGIKYNSGASNAGAALILGNESQVAYVQLNYKLQMLEVPVEFKYRIGNNRFGGGITAGAGALFNVANQVFASNTQGTYYLGSYKNISTVSVTGKLGLHIYYCPINALQITVEPGINYLLTTFNGSMPYSKNLQFGVQYNFNMKPKKK